MRFPSQYLPAPFAVDGFDASGNWGFDQNTLSVVATGDRGADQTANLEYRGHLRDPDREEHPLATARAGSDPAGEETLRIPDGSLRRGSGPGRQDHRKREYRWRQGKGDRGISDLRQVHLHPSGPRIDRNGNHQRLPVEGPGRLLHPLRHGHGDTRSAQGIPSRVAIGFTGGTRDGEGYKVTTDNMHAWPELYFEGLGWLPFEPTKSIGSSNTGENPPQSSPSPDPSVPPSTGAESPEPQPTEPTPTLAPSPVPSPGDGAQGTGAKSSGNWGWLLWGLPCSCCWPHPPWRGC